MQREFPGSAAFPKTAFPPCLVTPQDTCSDNIRVGKSVAPLAPI